MKNKLKTAHTQMQDRIIEVTTRPQVNQTRWRNYKMKKRRREREPSPCITHHTLSYIYHLHSAPQREYAQQHRVHVLLLEQVHGLEQVVLQHSQGSTRSGNNTHTETDRHTITIASVIYFRKYITLLLLLLLLLRLLLLLLLLTNCLTLGKHWCFPFAWRAF